MYDFELLFSVFDIEFILYLYVYCDLNSFTEFSPPGGIGCEIVQKVGLIEYLAKKYVFFSLSKFYHLAMLYGELVVLVVKLCKRSAWSNTWRSNLRIFLASTFESFAINFQKLCNPFQ